MTYRRLVAMGTRTTHSGGKRLLAAALLSGMAFVVLSSHDAHARPKRPETACLEMGGAVINDQCCFKGGETGKKDICSPLRQSRGVMQKPVLPPKDKSGTSTSKEGPTTNFDFSK